MRPDDPNIGVRTQKVLKDDFEISFAELELQLQQQYFKDGKIKLRCGESIGKLFESASDEFLGELTRPKPQKQGSFFGVIGGAPKIQSGNSFLLQWIPLVINLKGPTKSVQ